MSNTAAEEKITEFLRKENKGVNGSQISKETGINRVTLSKYLELLKTKNLVDYKERGMSKLWYLKNSTILKQEQDILDFIKREDETKHILLGGKSIVLVNNMRFLGSILRKIKTKLGDDEFNRSVFESSKEFAKNELELYAQLSGTDFSKLNISEKEKLVEIQVKLFISHGWGKITHLNINSKELNLVISHSTLPKIFGRQLSSAKSCHIMAGFLAGTMESAFQSNYLAEENSCISASDEYCEFKVKKVSASELSLQVMPGKNLTSDEYNKIISNYLKNKRRVTQ